MFGGKQRAAEAMALKLRDTILLTKHMLTFEEIVNHVKLYGLDASQDEQLGTITWVYPELPDFRFSFGHTGAQDLMIMGYGDFLAIMLSRHTHGTDSSSTRYDAAVEDFMHGRYGKLADKLVNALYPYPEFYNAKKEFESMFGKI